MVAHVMDYTKQNYLIMNCISLPQGVGVVLKIAIPTLNVPKYSCSNMLWKQSEGRSIPSRGEVYSHFVETPITTSFWITYLTD